MYRETPDNRGISGIHAGETVNKNEDGSYDWIYVHYDGYPAGVGRMLLDRYPTRERAMKLVALGDMSAVAPIPYSPSKAWRETFTGWHEGDQPWLTEIRSTMSETYCRTYGTPAQHVKDWHTLRRLFMASDREWLYVWDDKHGWRVLSAFGEWGAGRLTGLKPVVERNEKAWAK
ncbi:hypothetical protein [Bifidobacterium felsineum]|uniref:hypothetical protein n=1 Tax=Bifidobacterium felsineum TaxID=2045440 RepID=UPI001BDD93C6|nr:hypothetical protein [Bifidobacterium felsineum]MBT1164661.1 hypothetical protein [Bifidobacterium felsineum]